MKTNQQRFDDAINFIRDLNKAELAEHIITTARAGKVDQPTLGGDLALGKRGKKTDEESWDEDTKKRRALRSLLLCQRVYFSSMWAQRFGNNSSALTKADVFPGNSWDATFTASKDHWLGKKEDDIIEAILSFSVTSSTAEALMNAAASDKGDPKLTLPNVTVTRKTKPFAMSSTCFDAVRHWLVLSGLCSYRWYMRTLMPNPQALRTIFGNGEIIWKADTPFPEGSVLPKVKKGFIVYLSAPERPNGLGGHWLVSAGNGQGWGRNNDTIDNTDRTYALCNLSRQFLSYKEEVEGKQGVFWKGVAEVFDPTKIPNRL